MFEAMTHLLCTLGGGAIALTIVKPKLDQLRRLTDRDALGRFKGGK